MCKSVYMDSVVPTRIIDCISKALTRGAVTVLASQPERPDDVPEVDNDEDFLRHYR